MAELRKVTVYISPGVFARITELAKRSGISRAVFMRQALDAGSLLMGSVYASLPDFNAVAFHGFRAALQIAADEGILELTADFLGEEE